MPSFPGCLGASVCPRRLCSQHCARLVACRVEGHPKPQSSPSETHTPQMSRSVPDLWDQSVDNSLAPPLASTLPPTLGTQG